MTDYSVKVSVRNARILRLMREAGIGTQAELCRRAEITPTTLSAFVNLRRVPINKDGTWAHGVEDVAGALGCDPEDMFSGAQMTMALERNSAVVELAEADMAQLAGGDLEESVYIKHEAQRLLARVSPRERMVLTEISNGGTLAEIADEMGVSVERVRQISAKAVRRLKHPMHYSPLPGVA